MTRRNYSKLPDQPSQFDARQNDMPQNPLPPRNPYVVFTKKVFSTVATVGLFILVCKLTHFREKVLHDVRINRNFFRLFILCISTFLAMYIWMSIKGKWTRPANRRIPVDMWDKAMPKQFYTAVVAIALSVFSFIGAMWRTFQLMTFPIGILGLLTVVEILGWFPSI